MDTELWSIRENMAYSKENATLVKVGQVQVLATPKGEILVLRAK